jgi:hypothetical protein
MMALLYDTLFILGYRPEDDSWASDGRRTYIHDDDATRAFLITLRGILARQGWRRDGHVLRALYHPSGLRIEIEPGGDATGHFLHIFAAGPVA